MVAGPGEAAGDAAGEAAGDAAVLAAGEAALVAVSGVVLAAAGVVSPAFGVGDGCVVQPATAPIRRAVARTHPVVRAVIRPASLSLPTIPLSFRYPMPLRPGCLPGAAAVGTAAVGIAAVGIAALGANVVGHGG